MTRPVKLSAVAAVLALLAMPAPSTAAEAPANDHFADAIAIGDPAGFTATIDLSAATREAGEDIRCSVVQRSVWYSITTSERMDLTLQVSNNNASIAVFDGGPTLGDLTRRTCNSGNSVRGWTAEPGVTYWVQVGNRSQATGTTTLTVARVARITGTVLDHDGLPAEGECTRLYKASGERVYSPAVTGRIEASGSYAIRFVTPGDYLVQFTRCNDPRRLQTWHGGPTQADAIPVTVTPGAWQVAGIDAVMGRATVLRGSAIDEHGIPVRYSCVKAVDQDNQTWSGSIWQGTYALQVAPGTYRIEFGGCDKRWDRYATEWHADAASIDDATPVVAVEAADTVVDAVLDPGGSMSGTITAGGVPLSFACVDIIRPDGEMEARAYTDASGTWYMTYLDGTYTVRAADCRYDSMLVPATHGDPPTAIEVPWGADVSGIDVDLPLGGRISGALLDEEGFPAYNECANLYRTDGTPVAADYVYLDDYMFGSLEPGSYVLRFGCSSKYRQQWHQNASSFAEASPVTVTAGADVRIDAQLALRPPPANDLRSNATAIGTLPFRDDVDTLAATASPDDPRACTGSSSSTTVWYTFVPETLDVYTASTIGSDYDTAIAVYGGTAVGDVELGCANTHSNQIGERLQFVGVPGMPITIMVAGPNGRAGTLLFELS